MTAQKSSTENKVKREIVNRRLFNNELRRNWPQFVVFFIAFALTMIIPTAFIMSNYTGSEMSVDRLRSIAQNIASALATSIFVSSFLAVYAGCSTVSHINNKTAVGFWHSLPISREGLLLTGISVRGIYYFVSYFSALMISLLIAAPSGCLSFAAADIFRIILYSVVFFALFYSITVFGGMLTGTGATRFLMAGFIVFAPLVTAASAIWLFTYEADYTYADYYYSTVLSKLFPYTSINTGSPFKIIIYIVAAAVFFALAFLLYRFRKSESAGTPVIYRVCEEIVRYTCMFAATVFAGLIFEGIFGGMGLIVGFAIGAFLSFIVSNAVLKKSAQAMFAGINKLAIFAVAFMALFILFGADLINHDETLPPSYLTSEIEIYIDNTYYRFTSREDVKAVSEASEKLIQNHKISRNLSLEERTDKKLISFYNSAGLSANRRSNVTIYARTCLGFTSAKQVYCDENYALELVSALNDTKGSKNQIKDTLKKCKDSNLISVDIDGYYNYYSDKERIDDIYRFMLNHADYYTEENTDDVIIGYLIFDSDLNYNSQSYHFPIFRNDSALIAKLEDVGLGSFMYQNTEKFKKSIEIVYIFDKKTSQSITVKDKSEISAILDSVCVNFNNQKGYSLALSPFDDNYIVVLVSGDQGAIPTRFRTGHVPDFVK